jgi:hypothetical protein
MEQIRLLQNRRYPRLLYEHFSDAELNIMEQIRLLQNRRYPRLLYEHFSDADLERNPVHIDMEVMMDPNTELSYSV